MHWGNERLQEVLATAFLYLVFPIVGMVIARRKNRSTASWFALCLLFGPIGFIVLLALSPRGLKCPSCGHEISHRDSICPSCQIPTPSRWELERMQSRPQDSAHRCPHCGMPFCPDDYREDAEQKLCAGCHGDLDDLPAGQQSTPNKAPSDFISTKGQSGTPD